MADNTDKRAQKLVVFRKLERERASREVESARNAKESATNAVRDQQAQVAMEADRAQALNGTTKSPEDIQLALACVEATRSELLNKLEVLKNAEKHLGVKSKALLATHRKVQQMEALRERAAAAAKAEQKRKEQSEIDDMAGNREARK